MLLLLERLNLFNKNVPRFHINSVLLNLIMVGKGQESLPFPKIPLNEHVDFGKNETQKEIYHLLLFFAAQS